MSHEPVLMAEAIQGLAIQPDGIYIDGTFGRGGHSRQILAALSENGRLFCLDRDPDAIESAYRQFGEDSRVTICHSSFRDMDATAEKYNILGKVNGLLLDLGVSSPQLDNADRGFSFQRSGPLDMRMDPSEGHSAAAWLNTATEHEIAQVIKDYGEERFAKQIARAIVRERAEHPLETTHDLAKLVASQIPTREPGKHPATRTFQAVRLYINQELEALNKGLWASIPCLGPQGRLVVISFHSLEDRIVKRFMRDKVRGDVPDGLPLREDQINRTFKMIQKRIQPTEREIQHNPRSRSAILRVVEKV
ncbi:MAG: 16S rRNA (cytosine(1402)-N(4))-methyltransferase RsmH [Gammaproteobacteria bacterium]